MQQFETVAIVGVGLIGGSIGLALRRRGLAGRVIGVGRREATLRVARRSGAIDRGTTDLQRGVREAQLTVVCTPVAAIAASCREVAAACPAGALITDAGSTKASIVAALEGGLERGVRFVGSHPLAGSEQRGPEAARADLFEGRTVIMTPTRSTRPADYATIRRFWESLGAGVVRMAPEMHDRVVAATSHVPHLAAAAVALSVPSGQQALSAGGLRDTTRVAAGDPTLWRQILMDNRQAVLAALRPLEEALTALHEALRQGDADALERLLRKAKRKRDALGS